MLGRAFVAVVATAALAGCGTEVASESTTQQAADPTTTIEAPTKAELATKTFERSDVRECLSRARTSSGSLDTGQLDTTTYGKRFAMSGGIMEIGLMPHTSDGGYTVAVIGFAADRAEADAFVRWVRGAGDDLSPAGLFDVERRGNAVLVRADYDRELQRIFHGCLGGVPYRGNGRVPPPDPNSVYGS